MSQIKTGTRILTLAGFPVIALLTMGIAMPSCPGQQAIQQQIDALTTRANEGDQKLQGMTTQVGSLSKEMTDAKALLEQLSQTVIAQKGASRQSGRHGQRCRCRCQKEEVIPTQRACHSC
jgi:hypothetical protein